MGSAADLRDCVAATAGRNSSVADHAALEDVSPIDFGRRFRSDKVEKTAARSDRSRDRTSADSAPTAARSPGADSHGRGTAP